PPARGRNARRPAHPAACAARSRVAAPGINSQQAGNFRALRAGAFYLRGDRGHDWSTDRDRALTAQLSPQRRLQGERAPSRAASRKGGRMKDPERWLDRAELPDAIRARLQAEVPRGIPAAARQRGHLRVRRLAALPATGILA